MIGATGTRHWGVRACSPSSCSMQANITCYIPGGEAKPVVWSIPLMTWVSLASLESRLRSKNTYLFNLSDLLIHPIKWITLSEAQPLFCFANNTIICWCLQLYRPGMFFCIVLEGNTICWAEANRIRGTLSPRYCQAIQFSKKGLERYSEVNKCACMYASSSPGTWCLTSWNSCPPVRDVVINNMHSGECEAEFVRIQQNSRRVWKEAVTVFH